MKPPPPILFPPGLSTHPINIFPTKVLFFLSAPVAAFISKYNAGSIPFFLSFANSLGVNADVSKLLTGRDSSVEVVDVEVAVRTDAEPEPERLVVVRVELAEEEVGVEVEVGGLGVSKVGVRRGVIWSCCCCCCVVKGVRRVC